VEGFAFGAAPTAAQAEAIVAALAARRGSFDNELKALCRAPAVGKVVVEGLLRHPKVNLFAFEEHHEVLGTIVALLDTDAVLQALGRFTALKESKTYSCRRYLKGWTEDTDMLLATLISRDADKVIAAAAKWPAVARDGCALTLRRLGKGPALSPDLMRRLVVEGGDPPEKLLVLEGNGTRLTTYGAEGRLAFAFGGLFDSMDDYNREVLAFLVEPASADWNFGGQRFCNRSGG
jgi:hypothetical protein